MARRLTKIVTRTGDDGTTGLADGSRIDKSSARINVIGDIDELNSILGVLLSQDVPAEVRKLLTAVQHTLFDMGGELALPGKQFIMPETVGMLEREIERYNQALPALQEFILPGGQYMTAVCHLARAVCRRAERSAHGFEPTDKINQNSLKYLNRLSDLLFVIARVLARETGCAEVYWQKTTGPSNSK